MAWLLSIMTTVIILLFILLVVHIFDSRQLKLHINSLQALLDSTNRDYSAAVRDYRALKQEVHLLKQRNEASDDEFEEYRKKLITEMSKTKRAHTLVSTDA